ncbi:hypothetical protein AHAS_Ahas11G0242700 [Arachis hypogaea]
MEGYNMLGRKRTTHYWAFCHYSNICVMVADITHLLQQLAGKKLDGGGVVSGGLRELIPCIVRTAVAIGVDGIFMEVHDDPLSAPIDGPTQWCTVESSRVFQVMG